MRVLLIALSFVCSGAGAQNMPSSLVNSCGGTAGSSVKLVSSVGEPLVGKIGSGNIFLKQGFLIPKYSGVSTVAPSILPYTIYPNPADGFLKVRAAVDNVEFCAVFNMLGQRVALIPVTQNEVSVRDLAPGMYMLALMDRRKNRLATFSFLKK